MIYQIYKLDFDVIISSLAPKHRNNNERIIFKICKLGKPTELALFSSVPQLEIKFKIALIIWGENVGLQVGDMASTSKKQYDGRIEELNTLNSDDLG